MIFNITVKNQEEIKNYNNIQAKDETELRQWFKISKIPGTLEEITRA